MEKPKGFCEEADRVLLEQDSGSVRQVLWIDKDSDIFKITQLWKDGDEATIYLFLHELKELTQAARDHMSLPNDGIQDHEDYLDARGRHDDAMRRY